MFVFMTVFKVYGFENRYFKLWSCNLELQRLIFNSTDTSLICSVISAVLSIQLQRIWLGPGLTEPHII